ncbi:hypothetical protein REPUB_Repub08aG0052300 [Reevesia pubescens]
MVSIRFFSFVLVFILVLIGESSAHSQVREKIAAADGIGLEPARKNLADGIAYDAVPAVAEVGNWRLEGRKMMLKWALDKKTVTVEGSDGEENTKTSGADYQSVGKSSYRGKGILNVDRKLRNRNPHLHSRRHGKPKMAGKGIYGLNNQIGSSQEKFKNQDDRNMLKPNFVTTASPAASRKPSVKPPSKNQLCFQYAKPVSEKGRSECFSRSPELVPQQSDIFSQKLKPQKLLGAAKELMNFVKEDYQRPPTKPPVHNNEPSA